VFDIEEKKGEDDDDAADLKDTVLVATAPAPPNWIEMNWCNHSLTHSKCSHVPIRACSYCCVVDVMMYRTVAVYYNDDDDEWEEEDVC